MSSDHSKENKIAEIIETNSSRLVAQCYELYNTPGLGSLVKIGDNPVYAVIINITTTALDQGRKVLARGLDEPTEASLYRNNPQLDKLLVTYFDAIIIGFEDEDGRHYKLPPSPPHIHSFVTQCTGEEISSFTEKLDFLHSLLSTPVANIDQVIASFLLLSSKNHSNSTSFLAFAGKALANELAGEVIRLNAILRSLSR